MKFALRSLLKSPSYTIIALITLALGIGVNTSMYTLVDVLLLRAAPFPDGRELHQLIGETRQGRNYSYSEMELREIRAKSSSFASLTALRFNNTALAEPTACITARRSSTRRSSVGTPSKLSDMP